jgi:hypothetical protein
MLLASAASRASYGAAENKQCFVIGIDDAGEDGITASTVQATALEAASVDGRCAIAAEQSRRSSGSLEASEYGPSPAQARS